MTKIQELRQWLESEGFRFGIDQLRNQSNNCDWYAWRKISHDVRDCETNDSKVQIVVYPNSMDFGGSYCESIEVELCGEASGIWWKLLAYSLLPEELIAQLDGIEVSLAAAWNGLKPIANNTKDPAPVTVVSAGDIDGNVDVKLEVGL